MRLAHQPTEFLDHGLQRDFFHRLLDRVLNLVIGGLQHFADILRHRTGAALTVVDPDQGGDSFWFQRRIDLIHRDLGRIHAQLRTAGPSGDCNESRFFQSAENIADHNRVTAGTFGQEIAGNLGNSPRLVNKD